MNESRVIGRASTDSGEEIFTSGVNGVGAVVVPGSALCYSHTASNGRTFVLPTAEATVNNFMMFAGVLVDTLGTGSFTARIKRYGIVTALVSGGSTVVPGAHLGMVTATPAFTVFTLGQFVLSMLSAQTRRLTCLGTVTAGQGFIGVKAFIQY